MLDDIVGLRDSAARLVMLRTGNCFLEIHQYLKPIGRKNQPRREANDHGIAHLCFEVSDLEVEYERLKRAGVIFHCPPQRMDDENLDDSVRVTYARDPDGNILEFVQIGPGNILSLPQAPEPAA
jgi:catechol 2,3-dioxygenase-like lactoylglutathione lyase family enzyme